VPGWNSSDAAGEVALTGLPRGKRRPNPTTKAANQRSEDEGLRDMDFLLDLSEK
jgi:hypothetical protein